jgi:UPF0755 protein
MKFLRILFMLFCFSFGITLFFAGIVPSIGSTEHVRVDISSGQDVSSITQELKDAGVVRSALLLRLYLTWKEMDTKIKPGTFLFSQKMTYAEIAEMLVGGEGYETIVTIPEGYTVSQIDVLLSNMDLIQEGELEHCAQSCDFSSFAFLPSPYASGHGGSIEGYLFPDTYFVSVADFVPKFFLERLLSTFQKKVIAGLSDDFSVSDRSLHEIVTMASIIERETRSGDERAVIAGVLWKRFDSSRGLDADATIRYGLQKLTEPLTKTDLENPNAFNTRRHRGLPPGPVANAGLESLRAALNPSVSEYWYYLHGKDGKIRYAETNDEHNENKAKYL